MGFGSAPGIAPADESRELWGVSPVIEPLRNKYFLPLGMPAEVSENGRWIQ